MKHIPNNEIWYTTANGEILSNFDKYAFSSNLISNEYTNNHGVLTFANDLTIIGNSAFALCEELESIIITDTIVKIDEGAFSCCENLQEITKHNHHESNKKNIGHHQEGPAHPRRSEERLQAHLQERAAQKQEQQERGCEGRQHLPHPLRIHASETLAERPETG